MYGLHHGHRNKEYANLRWLVSLPRFACVCMSELWKFSPRISSVLMLKWLEANAMLPRTELSSLHHVSLWEADQRGILRDMTHKLNIKRNAVIKNQTAGDRTCHSSSQRLRTVEAWDAGSEHLTSQSVRQNWQLQAQKCDPHFAGRRMWVSRLECCEDSVFFCSPLSIGGGKSHLNVIGVGSGAGKNIHSGAQ